MARAAGWRTASALLLVATGSAALGVTRTYPGGAPCDTTLQACIDGATSGDTVEIATNTAIDENLSIDKSLALTAAAGFTPVIGNSLMTRVLRVSDGGPASAVVVAISGLVLSNARVSADYLAGAGHTLTVEGCTISHAVSNNNSRGIDLMLGAPATVLIRNNRVTTTGIPVAIFTSLAAGDAAVTVLGNRLSASDPSLGYDGISVFLTGAGTATVNIYSNLIFAMTGCTCGNGAGIEIGTDGSVTATVNVVNNTIDDLLAAFTVGFGILVTDPTGTSELTTNIFNNIVTDTPESGMRLGSANPRLVVNNGFNDFFNTAPNLYGGHTEGPSTLSTDPLYVNVAGRDYHLQAGSPLRDFGLNNPTGGLPPTDADGNLRVANAVVDLGAFEFGSTPPTTTSTSTTTTTTLPGTCARAATFASIRCRLEALTTSTQTNVPPGPLGNKLLRALGKAKTKVESAERLAGEGKTRPLRRSLSKAIAALGKFVKRLGSQKAQALPETVRAALTATAEELRADLGVLRGP